MSGRPYINHAIGELEDRPVSQQLTREQLAAVAVELTRSKECPRVVPLMERVAELFGTAVAEKSPEVER
jgi:hypothetical protein